MSVEDHELMGPMLSSWECQRLAYQRVLGGMQEVFCCNPGFSIKKVTMGEEKQFHITYIQNLSFENLNFKNELNVEETCFKRYKKEIPYPDTYLF